MDWKQQFQDALDEADTSDGEPRIIGQSDILFTEPSLPWKAKRMRFIAIPGILILFLIFVWWMVGEMLGYTAYARMKSHCGMAHQFAKACNTLAADGMTLEPGIWQIQRGESEFQDGILRYCSNAEGGWYGLALDADGAIAYTLYSQEEIPAQYLTIPPDGEEQMALLDSHFAFRRRKAVAVWYTDDSRNITNN